MTALRTIDSSTYTPKKQFKSWNTDRFKLMNKHCFYFTILILFKRYNIRFIRWLAYDCNDDLNQKKKKELLEFTSIRKNG